MNCPVCNIVIYEELECADPKFCCQCGASLDATENNNLSITTVELDNLVEFLDKNNSIVEDAAIPLHHTMLTLTFLMENKLLKPNPMTLAILQYMFVYSDEHRHKISTNSDEVPFSGTGKKKH